MQAEDVAELNRIAKALNPVFEGRVSWDPGDPICPEWIFPIGTDVGTILAAILKLHRPGGCWPVGPIDNPTGIRVVAGPFVKLRS